MGYYLYCGRHNFHQFSEIKTFNGKEQTKGLCDSVGRYFNKQLMDIASTSFGFEIYMALLRFP
jgi:hypothetical protein